MPDAFPKRGESWTVEFPDDPKSRPALIVSPDARNEFANSVLAIPITTNMKMSPTHVTLPAGQGGLRQDSMARCENVSYIHKSRLRRGGYGGLVSRSLMSDVERCLLRAFGISA